MTDRLPRQADPWTSASASIASMPARPLPAKGAVYLDYAATTPTDPSVVRVMNDFLMADGVFGNPASAVHGFGRAAMEAVEDARREVAKLLSSSPEEVIWTSGATESINLALKGVSLARRDRGNHIVVSALEHKAVLDSAAWLKTQGFSISYIKPDAMGTITPENLLKVLRPDTIVVSLMHVNNETGAVTDISALGPLVRQNGALLHVDAVQSAARLPLDHIADEADFISISAHKMYGPKGVGALRIRGSIRTDLVPQVHGGGHERGLRSGTLPTHQIAGMGYAAKLVQQRRKADVSHVIALDCLLCEYLKGIDGIAVNGSSENRIPGIINIHFADVEAESLMLALDDIAISSGSACTSSDVHPSHVLIALGYDKDRALSSVRFSFGRFTTTDEIDRTGQAVREAVTMLRKLSR